MKDVALRLRKVTGMTNGSTETTERNLLGAAHDSGGLIADLPMPVLLYRSASPQLSDSDLQKLLRLVEESSGDQPAEWLKQRSPAAPGGNYREITADGYQKALEVRESLGIPPDAPIQGDHDLATGILPALGVRVVNITLDDSDVSGVALFGPGHCPTAAVNLTGTFSKHPSGRRMTLAHELCHLLFDGRTGGRFGLVSNNWAYYPAERRANAFAAYFLAPDAAIASVLPRDSTTWTRGMLNAARIHLGVGVQTLTWNLYRLGWISDGERQAWLDELAG
jgi:Zn-dependent peptidase ImmA (M78 family)